MVLPFFFSIMSGQQLKKLKFKYTKPTDWMVGCCHRAVIYTFSNRWELFTPSATSLKVRVGFNRLGIPGFPSLWEIRYIY